MSDDRTRAHVRMAGEDLGAAVAAAREAMRAGSPRAVRQALRALVGHVPDGRRRELVRRLADLSLRADLEWLSRDQRRLQERELAIVADLAEGRETAYAPASDEGLAVRRAQREPESVDPLQIVAQAASGRASIMRRTTAVGARMDHGPEAEARVLDAAQCLLDDVVAALVEACEECAVVSDTRTRALARLRQDGIRLVPDPREPGSVAAESVPEAVARAVERDLRALGVEVSWAPDHDDDSLAWIYVRLPERAR